MNGASKLVGELVKLDRLPNETSLQGLLLLKGAWCEYDVTMSMAATYKFRSKMIFLIQLFLAWAVIFIAVTRSEISSDTQCLLLTTDERKMLSHVIFGLAIVITLSSSLDTILNAKTRWRQLRSCSCSLESIIWSYRARIGRFEQSISETSRPEVELCNAINAWRLDLVSAADLQASDLEKHRTPEVYKHNQIVTSDLRQLREEVAATKTSIDQVEASSSKATTDVNVQELRAKLRR